MKHIGLGVLALVSAMQVLAHDQAGPAAPDVASAYQQIEAERAREAEQFTVQEAACYQRFAVNDCLKQLQSKHLEVSAELKRRETLLHSAERARQGAEQLKRTQQKVQESQQVSDQAQEGAVRAQEKLKEQQEKQAAHSAPRGAKSTATPASSPPPGVSAKEQASNRAHYAAKLAAAEKKRKDVAKRRKDSQSDQPVPALPLPK